MYIILHSTFIGTATRKFNKKKKKEMRNGKEKKKYIFPT